jgi:acylphosphatase
MAKELILSGIVQGVFCRKYCSDYAKKFGIKGSVSNLSNGTVRIILDCDDDQKISIYIQAIKHNPYGFTFYGRIDEVSMSNYAGSIRGDYVF